MQKARLWLSLAFLLLLPNAFAVPAPPSEISAEFVEYMYVKISWQHSGGPDVSFNVYKGPTAGEAKLLANAADKFFVDGRLEPGSEHVYFVTAVDRNGESQVLRTISVTAPGVQDNPLTITLVSPTVDSLRFGENVLFEATVQSKTVQPLEDLQVTIINKQFDLNEPMQFDNEKKVFFFSAKIPEQEQASSTTYTVLVRAVFAGEPVFVSKSWSFSLAPEITKQEPTKKGGSQQQDSFRSILPALIVVFLLIAAALLFARGRKQAAVGIGE